MRRLRDMTDFDHNNHWLIDRGDGRPSVNLVILSFVDGKPTYAPPIPPLFWAAERPSTRGVTTTPPNTCEGGVGVGAATYQVPIPEPALRQS
jgi:hypothetical protein